MAEEWSVGQSLESKRSRKPYLARFPFNEFLRTPSQLLEGRIHWVAAVEDDELDPW